MKLTFKERVEKLAATIAINLPSRLIKLLAGTPIQIDGNTMDSYIQFMVKYFGDKPGYLPEPDIKRRGFDVQGDWLAYPPHPDVEITALTFSGPNGDIPCELHRPKAINSPDAPILIFYHGGGHVAGSLISHRNVCRQLAYEVNCLVLAVDYRLAPEYKFPTGIQDCLASYDYVAENFQLLGVDPNKISIGGDSAGGNIAAVIAQQRKQAKHPPKFQMLWVPWVDMSNESASYQSVGEGFFLERIEMRWYTNHYLSDPQDALNPMASPLLGDITGVCPACIIVAGFDPLRDEGIAYAEKLKSGGIKADLRFYSGAIHPLVNIAGKIPIAQSAFKDAVNALKENM